MAKLRVYDGEFGKLRCVIHNNKIFYHGNDVVKNLGYSEPKVLNDCVDSDDKIEIDVTEIDTGREQKTVMINPFGMQSLISAIPMNTGRISKFVNTKAYKKWVSTLDVKCYEDSISDFDKTVLKILHAKDAEDIANSLVAYKNIIQGKMKTSVVNEGIQLQFESATNSPKYYLRTDVANKLGVSNVKLNKFMKLLGWCGSDKNNKNCYAKRSAIEDGYCIRYGRANQWGVTEKGFDLLKEKVSLIDEIPDIRNRK